MAGIGSVPQKKPSNPIFPVRRTKENQGYRAIYVEIFICLENSGRPSLKIYNAKLALIA